MNLKRILILPLLLLALSACQPLSIPGSWMKTASDPIPGISEDDPNWDCNTNGNGICGPLTAEIDWHSGWVAVRDAYGIQVMRVQLGTQTRIDQGYLIIFDGETTLGAIAPGGWNAMPAFPNPF